jgi:hypothetical protein
MAARKPKPVRKTPKPTFSGLFPPNRPLGKPFPASNEHAVQPKRTLVQPPAPKGRNRPKPRKAT